MSKEQQTFKWSFYMTEYCKKCGDELDPDGLCFNCDHNGYDG